MSTNSLSAKSIIRKWHLVNAKDKILGRLATEIAILLMGKNKAQYVPYLDSGDYVVIINASKVIMSGKKMSQKQYIRHSGYPGGLKMETFKNLINRDPEKIIQHAVKGMLPKTQLGRQMIVRLYVFPGSDHSFKNQIKEEIGQQQAPITNLVQ